MKTPQISNEGHADASTSSAAALMMFALRYDVAIPLTYFADVISRSEAFRARKEGKLHLELAASRASIKPSVLAAYMEKKSAAGIRRGRAQEEAA